MRLPTRTRTAVVKAATLVAVAALLVTSCGSNSSDDSDTNGSKPATVSTPKLPKTKIIVLTGWATDPGNPYVQYRIVKIWGTCLVETEPVTTGDVHPPTPLTSCIDPNK